MSDVEVRKMYVHFREGIPETDVGAAAFYGFKTLGVEVVPFEHEFDVDEHMHDLGPEVGVAGFVGDVNRALVKIGVGVPEPYDYPEELRDVSWMGRSVAKSTLGAVRDGAHGERVFVKSVERKIMSGFVYDRHDAEARRRGITLHDDTPVWVSDVVNFVSEYRAFVLHERVIDVRRYRGDWACAPSRDVIESAVKILAKTKKYPRSYCIDFGVIEKQVPGAIWKDLKASRETYPQRATVLVELNERFSFGSYGLPSVSYARMLSAGWYELARSREGKT